jgi:hypothetical protein
MFELLLVMILLDLFCEVQSENARSEMLSAHVNCRLLAHKCHNKNFSFGFYYFNNVFKRQD